MSRSPRLTDAQRRAAVDRARQNLALRSGAGCGKTLVLASRFAELLDRGEGEDALRRLVALTFTEKAAVEMSQRVGRMLAERAADAPPGAKRQRLRAWLEEFSEARISTIHGFCASLLRAHAIEAGLDPAFTVLADELVADALAADAADAAVLAAVESEDEGAARLLAHRRYDTLVEQVRRIMALRTVCEVGEYERADETLDRWRRHLRAEGEEAWAELRADGDFARRLDELAAAPCTRDDDKLAARRGETLARVRAMLADPNQRTAENFQAVTAPVRNIGSNEAWGGSAKAVRDRLKAVIETIKPLEVYCGEVGEHDREAAEDLAALAALTRRARRNYDAAKRSRGALDFDDLLVHAHRVLRDHAGVRRALADQIDQLLVDECQDTDALQVSLLEMLARPDDRSATGEGRLFVVGDAKQSIYRFRGAQVEVFEELCAALGEDAQEELEVSFRTHAGGVAFVNRLFAPLMGDDYAALRAHRAERPPGASVEILLAEACERYPHTDAAAVSRAQAALTAERIADMLDRGERLVWDRDAGRWRSARAGDVAILFARMTTSLDYERELQQRGIAYHVLAGTGFFQQQEVFDVLNALRAIDNPHDDVAFFGVLRSSLFGLDDDALLHVARTHGPPYLPGLELSRLADVLPAAQHEALAWACRLLGALHALRDAVGIDELVEYVLAATGLEATLLSQFQGPRMLGNVRLLIDRARSAAAEGLALTDFIDRMNEQVINESRYEQAAVAGEHENVVRLLTIHKAKGLEFPVVFVPDLNAGRLAPTPALLHRRDWGLTYKGRAEDKGDEALAWRAAAGRERDEARREDIRKLYVAATRHEDHLVFVGADWRKQDGTLRQSGCYLDRMDGVLDIRGALDAGAESIPYGDGGEAVVRLCRPAAPRRRRGRPSRGRRLLEQSAGGADLGERILRLAKRRRAAAPPLVGPLPENVGGAELAVTALSEFEHCPRLYRLRYELRVPPGRVPQPAGRRTATAAADAIDPAALGTLLHRCMELLDFRRPQRPRDLVARAAAEADMEDLADLEAIAAELGRMLDRLADHPLYGSIASALRAERELEFILRRPPVVLRGQIDLLYEDAGGAWHVVDYKSDRVAPPQPSPAADDALGAHARRYELQMLAYAAAAARQMGRAAVDATLYFLRPAAAHTFDLSAGDLASGEQRLARVARALIAARRSGRFEPRRGEHCAVCPYAALCRRAGPHA